MTIVSSHYSSSRCPEEAKEQGKGGRELGGPPYFATSFSGSQHLLVPCGHTDKDGGSKGVLVLYFLYCSRFISWLSSLLSTRTHYPLSFRPRTPSHSVSDAMENTKPQ